MRFFDDRGGEDFLTDLVCCPDELARQGALEEGLPPDRLLVTGSPSLSALADRVKEFARNPPPLPVCWAESRVRARVLFLSENHVVDYGTARDRPGGLGPWLGYTEGDVRAILARLLAAAGTRLSGGRKTASGSRLRPGAAGTGMARGIPGTTMALPLACRHRHWDAGRWRCSRRLSMGHRPLSFQPNLQAADQCTAVRLALADRARSEEEVRAWLLRPTREALFAGLRSRTVVPRPGSWMRRCGAQQPVEHSMGPSIFRGHDFVACAHRRAARPTIGWRRCRTRACDGVELLVRDHSPAADIRRYGRDRSGFALRSNRYYFL